MGRNLIDTIQKLLERSFNPKETLSLLKSDIYRFLSWGVSKIVSFESKGLLLKVNGHHHKSYVLITLAWDDTYTVHILSNRGKVLDTYTTVYFDELFNVIDKRIEYVNDYAR